MKRRQYTIPPIDGPDDVVEEEATRYDPVTGRTITQMVTRGESLIWSLSLSYETPEDLARRLSASSGFSDVIETILEDGDLLDDTKKKLIKHLATYIRVAEEQVRAAFRGNAWSVHEGKAPPPIFFGRPIIRTT